VDTAWYILGSTGNLELLSEVPDSSWTRIEDLPTWIPDWSVQLRPDKLKLTHNSGESANEWAQKHWCATDTLEWRCFTGVVTRQLHVGGRRVDVIVRVAVLGQMIGGMVVPAIDSMAQVTPALPRVYPWAWGRTKVGTGRAKWHQRTRPLHGNPAPKVDSKIRKHEITVVKSSQRIDVPTAQSRDEALWRVLTSNSVDGHYPAPESLGYGFGDWIADNSAWEEHAKNRDCEHRKLHRELVDSELNCRYSDLEQDPLEHFQEQEQFSSIGAQVCFPDTGLVSYLQTCLQARLARKFAEAGACAHESDAI
jgi:hypothetical protein